MGLSYELVEGMSGGGWPSKIGKIKKAADLPRSDGLFADWHVELLDSKDTTGG